MNKHSNVSISVVICTRNRSRQLAETFDSLNGQNYPSELYEIVLVDNGSRDDTPLVATQQQSRSKCRFTYVVEQRVGLAYARNRGWRTSTNTVILYLDDDVIVHSDCLGSLARDYQRFWNLTSPIAIGGRVRLKLVDGLSYPNWLDEVSKDWLSRLDLGPSSRVLNDGEMLVGACFSLPKTTIERVSGFNESLTSYGYDERWVEERILQIGGKLVFSSACVVDHVVHEARLTKKWFWRRLILEGMSHTRFQNALRQSSRPVQLIHLIRKLLAVVRDLPIATFSLLSDSPSIFRLSLRACYNLGAFKELVCQRLYGS